MDLPLVDTNIRKIITHFFYNDAVQKEKIIEQKALKILPKDRSWEWHQALMDFGALELPKLLPKKKTVKEQVPFRNTHRFIRGKIIDLLRDGVYPKRKLFLKLKDMTKRDRKVIAKNLQSLLGEGLVVFEKEKYQLGE
jgi:A/G-specific adenine glycosylase